MEDGARMKAMIAEKQDGKTDKSSDTDMEGDAGWRPFLKEATVQELKLLIAKGE